MKETQGFFQRVAQRYVGGFSLIKLSIYPLGNTPSAPSASHQDSRKLLRPKIETKTAGVRSGLQWSLANDSRGEVKSRAKIK